MSHKKILFSGPAIIVVAFSCRSFSYLGLEEGADMVVSQVGQIFLIKARAMQVIFCLKENHQEREKARTSQEGESKDLR